MKISVKVNEIMREIDNGVTTFDLRNQFKPEADLITLNGFPVDKEHPLKDGDEMVLIRRGEFPSQSEMEAQMTARHTPGVHRKVKAASVGIAGCGGLGSAVAIALARIGVGKLVLADFDVVEPSNLNRQQFFVDQIGQPKTKALRDNLLRINPYVEVEAHQVVLGPENSTEIFAKTPIIAEAFDRPAMKEMLIVAVSNRMPAHRIVAVSGLAGHGSNNTIQTERVTSQLYLIGDQVSGAEQGRGLMAPRVGIAAHHQANQILRLILGEENP
jgi:sulfur carrier protein ThiS adenylyltransferase